METRLKQEVKMVGHEAVCYDAYREFVTVLFEQTQKVEIVLRFEKNLLAVSTAMVNVIILSGLEFSIAIRHVNSLPFCLRTIRKGQKQKPSGPLVLRNRGSRIQARFL